jgi:ABC-2 type transport system ATP-binding protein
MRGRIRISLLAGTLAFVLAAPGAQARDAIVESFDGTPMVTHFSPAPGLEPGERAPTIMIGHGWGGTGATSPPADFAAAGYNILTWDARGFGGSGGTVMIDHPRFEGRDVSALIDFVAKQPEAKRDRPGDPRVGMSGGSYGGGIQFLAAARDRRIDAITPTIAWNNLLSSLYPRASVKAGWDLALIGVGIPTSVALGVFSPAGIQTGHQSERFYNSVVGGLATGMLPSSELPWFRAHGPDFLLKRIKVPTLIAQGTVDTLFDLDQAHRNYRALKRQRIPLKMMWFCGGHGVCNVEGDGAAVIGDSDRVQKRRLQWFKRYLKGKRRTRTGPAFEWIDQNGKWHRSGAYPLKRTGALRGSGDGLVPLVPGVNPTSGVLVAALPDPLAPIKVPIRAQGGERIVGGPRIKLTYSTAGIGTTRTDGLTHVYGQIVDRDRNVVVGNQATPIPIKLDGRTHTIKRTLTRIASVGTPAGYELQILGQSNLFDAQRAAGALTVRSVRVALPTTRSRKRSR